MARRPGALRGGPVGRGGLTAPSGSPRKSSRCALEVRDDAPRRVVILHPGIDLKHFFAGFIAVFNLARRLAERGHSVRLVALEGSEPPADWRDTLAAYEGIGDWIQELDVVYAGDRSRSIEASPDDVLVATHFTAAHVAAATLPQLRAEHFLYLIQEYEPLTFPAGSAWALARQSYELPHTALFSTDLLRDWFAKERIGVFAAGPEEGHERSAVFANAITPVGDISATDLERSGPRRLLFYARPERHAARNLIEIGAMALDQAIAGGALEGWELLGVGTVELGDGTIGLPRSGAALKLVPRRSQAEYAALLRSCDAGMALMATPHPSLVPIEMAAAGMPVVTTTFANKDAAALAKISANLIAAEQTVDSVAAALVEAERRADDLEARARGSKVDWPSTWDEALGDDAMAGSRASRASASAGLLSFEP